MWGGAGSDLVPPLFRPRGATFPQGKVGGRLVAALRCFPFIRVFRGNAGCFPSSVRALGPDTFPGGEIGADALAFYPEPGLNVQGVPSTPVPGSARSTLGRHRGLFSVPLVGPIYAKTPRKPLLNSDKKLIYLSTVS